MTNTIYHPYFYIIQNINTSIFYAGSKYAKDADSDNLMKLDGYHTSSKVIKNLILKEGLDSFIIKRIKIFNTSEEAYDYETRFLNKVNAMNNPMFYNMSNNNIISNTKNKQSIKYIKNSYSLATKNSLSILGNIIRIARKEKNYTTNELAIRLGVSRSKIQRIEKGDLSVSIGSIIECCFILGIDIFGGDKEHISNLSNMLMYMNRLLPDRVIKEHILDDDF